MSAATVSYTCAVCKVASEAVVRGLTLADVPVHKGGRVVFLRPQIARAQIDAGLATAIDLPTKSLEDLATERLLYATCPECNAQNPAGVRAQKKAVLHSRLLGLSMLVVTAGAAWWFSWFGLAVPILSLALLFASLVIRLRWKAPLLWPQLATGAIVALAVGWFALRVPNWAWLAPFPLLLPPILRPAEAGPSKWKETLSQVSFSPAADSSPEATTSLVGSASA